MLSRILLVCTVFILSACSGESSPQKFLSQANSAKADGRYSAAIILYKKALQQDISLIEARFELGELYAQLGHLKDAERFLAAAVEKEFSTEKALPLLASVYLQLNKLVELETLLEQQLSNEPAATPSPTLELALSLYKVLLLSRTEQLELAQSTLDALWDEPLDCELCLLTLAELESHHAPAKALSTLDELLQKYPANAQAYLLRGQLYFALRNPSQAYSNFLQFQKIQVNTAYAHLLLAISALQMDDAEAATKHVDNLLSLDPRQPVANHLKALLVFADRDYEAAKDYAEKSISRGFKPPANYLVAGVSAYHVDSLEAAYEHLSRAVRFYPDNGELQRLLLLIQVKLGSLSEAQEQFVNQDGRTVQDLLFGNAMAYQLIQNQQYSAASNVLAYLENVPNSHPAIRLQTMALKTRLDPIDALASPEMSTQKSESADTGRLAAILLLIQGNALTEAKVRAEQWLADAPKNIDALNLLAYTYQKLRMPEEAQALYSRALLVEPRNIPSLLFAANTAILQGNYIAAKDNYRLVLSINPANLSALQALLRMTFVSTDTPDFDDLLQLISISSVSDDQVVAIADTLFQWRQYQRLNTFLESYQAEREWSDMLWMVWLKNGYYLNGAEQFVTNYTLFSRENSSAEQAIFALSILEENSQFALILALIDGLESQTQQLNTVRLVKASALISLQQDDAAEEVLLSLDQNQGLSDAQWYVRGRIMEHRNDLAQAASYFSVYYQTSPSFTSVTSLARVLQKAGRTDELAVLARKHTSNHPEDSSARVSLAFKLVPSHTSTALELLQTEHVKWLVKRNWKLSNNMAALYMLEQDPASAFIYSTNALELNPTHDGVKQMHSRVQKRLNLPRKANGS